LLGEIDRVYFGGSAHRAEIDRCIVKMLNTRLIGLVVTGTDFYDSFGWWRQHFFNFSRFRRLFRNLERPHFKRSIGLDHLEPRFG